MAKGQKAAKFNEVKTTDYRHSGEKRSNIPPAKIAAEGKVPRVPRARYYYNPHLPPVLRFDPSGEADGVKELVYEAARRPLREEEVIRVAEAVEHYGPWLEWTGKREENEKRYFEVDPVALHIHERVSAQAIIRAAMREDVQRDLFADPQQPYKQAIQFYKHDVDWANRLILGDSVQVMSSLARRENLAGKVQMIYMDPPYGIRFGANFQPLVSETEVGDKEKDLVRETETVKAYRDTWALGIHSYLMYLRTRLVAARELLSVFGSIFVQISDLNIHRVRTLMDEVFGEQNYICQIQFKKTGSASSFGLATVCDYLLWYAKDASQVLIQNVYRKIDITELDLQFYDRVLTEYGELRPLTPAEKQNIKLIGGNAMLVARNPVVSPGTSKSSSEPIKFEGDSFPCPLGRHWSQEPGGMQRLIRASRICKKGKTLRFVKHASDSEIEGLTNAWMDLGSGGFVGEKKKFIVKTDLRVIERCLLLTTRPGDLVLDPTCGGGSTAFAAEKWGRRWITIDTSRVAIALSRQRLLTECQFPYFQLRNEAAGPQGGFIYRTARHIEPSDIAKNVNLDSILARYEVILEEKLKAANKVLAFVSEETRHALAVKLTAKEKNEGKRTVTDADRRRWVLPKTNGKWEHWTVPFDIDPTWPKKLQDAVTDYRKVWREKIHQVSVCITSNVEPAELVNEPEPVKGVIRVSGPFTVEGVRPEELSLGEAGFFDATLNELDHETGEVELDNINAYLTLMMQHLRIDGLTFIGNQCKKFARLEALFETQTGSIVHAEGVWEGGDLNGSNTVAVGFGPQYGPVTALQVEELIRAAKRYDEVVVAGFSFDAEATEVIQAQSHPNLRIHQAYIRPDINPAMEGLLKDTPNSQLFTVFGQPELELNRTDDGEWVLKLVGVDIYDPIENTVRSSGAEKVAAWFLDSDYDGRCFCITQAFFPDQDAWEKIAKALGSSADAEAFEKFAGTESLPFKPGKYKRVAVKVIDPRGNEVMAVRQLEV